MRKLPCKGLPVWRLLVCYRPLASWPATRARPCVHRRSNFLDSKRTAKELKDNCWGSSATPNNQYSQKQLSASYGHHGRRSLNARPAAPSAGTPGPQKARGRQDNTQNCLCHAMCCCRRDHSRKRLLEPTPIARHYNSTHGQPGCSGHITMDRNEAQRHPPQYTTPTGDGSIEGFG